MKHLKIKIILLFNIRLFGVETYENPFLNSPEFELNQFKQFSVIEITNNDSPVNKSEIKEIVDKRKFNGTALDTVKFTETSYDNNGFPIQDVSYIVYADDWAIKSSSEYTNDLSGQSLISVIGSEPTKAFLEIGEQWEIMASEMLKLDISENVSITGILTHLFEYEFHGTETISTIWGNFQAAKIKSLISQSYEYFDAIVSFEGDAILVEIPSFTVTAERTEYYVKGFGRYKSISTRTTSSWSEKNTNLRTQEHNTWEYPMKTVYRESTITSTNFNFTPSSFLSNSSPQFKDNLYLNSWTWNGSFPWIYNSSTDSWFYYYFVGNNVNAYDARSSSWHTFNHSSEEWVPVAE
ncbi:MAG: hypothetical protein VW576_09620 [Opitutae bacterium]